MIDMSELKFKVGDIVKVVRIDEVVSAGSQEDVGEFLHKVGKVYDLGIIYQGIQMYAVEFINGDEMHFGETELELYNKEEEKMKQLEKEEFLYDKLQMKTIGFDGTTITKIKVDSLEELQKFKESFVTDSIFLYNKEELEYPNTYYLVNHSALGERPVFDIKDKDEFEQYVLDNIDDEIMEIIKNYLTYKYE